MQNPIIDLEPLYSPRDPALIYHNGVYRCFHSAADTFEGNIRFRLGVGESTDLRNWGNFRILADSELNFSSPGNVLKVKDEWVLCLQSYPIPAGFRHGSEDSRLWLMRSRDLETWSSPRMIQPRGCDVRWTASRRQIDPYLVEAFGQFWCFYKASGALGLLVSDDLETWKEASPDKPVLSKADLPDGATVENPCVVPDGEGFVMFFSPCRTGRGIGFARSQNLLDWTEIRYLDFPELAWAEGGPTAAMVIDRRQDTGKWLMVFHGDRPAHFGAAIGSAWSTDLIHWDGTPGR